MVNRNDYDAAKQHIIQKTLKYARKIIPDDIVTKIKIKNVSKSGDGCCSYPTLAYAAGNKDWTKTLIVYDSNMIRNNVYNMKSTFFDALAIHELCHIRHGFEEPGAKPRFYHSRPIYLDCMEKHYERGMASSRTHPDRYSLRAYLGSKHKLVPSYINGLMFYVCKDCRNSALWNNYYIGHQPYHCESCHSENIAWTILNPMDAYRIAMINDIDRVDRTASAMYNES
jgi:hypothetical protein